MEKIKGVLKMGANAFKNELNIDLSGKIIKAVKSLPEDKQFEVLDFIEYLQSKTSAQDRYFALKKEFSEWDVLSDEAINDFEGNLS
jgi:hypothetical protein